MQQPQHYAGTNVFAENLPPRSGVPGYETIQAIRSLAHDFGIITSFKAYLEVSPSLTLWSELQAAGVALVDCPHSGRAEAASKMLIVDLITFAIDHPAPATILLISEDRDFAYAISTLRHRKFKVVLICPPDAHGSLVAQADVHFDWYAKVLRGSEGDGMRPAPSSVPHRPCHLSTSINGVTSDSDRKGKDRENNDVASHRDHQSYFYSDRHERTLPNTTNSWRTPTRTTSHSPARSFQSLEPAPRTFSPLPKNKPIERTFVTDGDIVFEGSSQPDLREGFPLSENETSRESRNVQSSTTALAYTNVMTSTPVPTPPPATSVGANILQKPPVPPFSSVAHATIVTPAATPVPSTTTVPAPSATVSATPPVNTKAGHKSILPTAQPHSKRTPSPMPAVVKPAPSHFLPLIAALQKRAREQKQKSIPRTDLGTDLAKVKGLYAQAKVSKFSSYMLLAEDAGIVTLGGTGSHAWVSLRPEWASSSVFPS
ncbi:hypothetical protein C0993_006145 [Termitomyces sp. T159_Od127]|nr:hypothetical protein C0993_006145 [Termitomyces sp. T159_Od127]